MHNTSFLYTQTRQAQQEQQSIQFSTDGLYEIHMLSVTVNRTEIDESQVIPELVVSWGNRTSGEVSVPELIENPGM